jgi:hypothetical protein
MAIGRPKAVLVLDAELREPARKFGQLAVSSGGIGASGQVYFVERFWEDEPGIARQLETSKVTVSLWRCRFPRHGVSGLYNESIESGERATSEESS